MDISYIPLKNDFEKTYRAAESNKHLWLLIFIEFLALCAAMIRCSVHTRTAWVTAAASGFLNNWAATLESGDSPRKCGHSHNCYGVNGVAPLCMLLVDGAATDCVARSCSANFDPREVFDTSRNGSVWRVFICMV